jgi:hypothetical protein
VWRTDPLITDVGVRAAGKVMRDAPIKCWCRRTVVQGVGLRIMVSYAREDYVIAQELTETLRLFGYDPWTDSSAHSGAAWWTEIVYRVQQCDVLLTALSPSLLTSRACTLERQYALALNKVQLPVMLAPVAMHSLPPDFTYVHVLPRSS